MEYRILGSLEARSNGHSIDLGPPKQRSLMALLLLHAEHVVPVDSIVEALWGDGPPETAVHSIQVYVSNLRKALPPDVIETRPAGYVFHLGTASLDADLLETLTDKAADALNRERFDVSLALMEDAAALWRGPALSEFRYEEFAHTEAERLEELHRRAEEVACRALLGLDRTVEALPRLQGLAASNPLHDGYVELLMWSLFRQGRQAEALRVFAQHRRLLGETLGIEPSPRLQQLEERILLQDGTLREGLDPGVKALQDTMPPFVVHNPYRGLRPFGEQDAGNFFGRDHLVERLLSAISGPYRMLAVVGPSGSGKSSVIRAGLVPRLRAGAIPGSSSWRVAVMVPGADPFVQLEAALLRSTASGSASPTGSLDRNDRGILEAVPGVLGDDETELVLVIDQFEELFTLVPDAVRTRFLRGLLEATADPHSRTRLVATLRADFYDRPMQYAEFGAKFTENVVNITTFTVAEYEEAATRPAANAGVTVEPSLVAALVSDVVAQPGGLPLFQYALTELFEGRDAPVLRLDSYLAMGGLKGALARRAEAALAALDEGGRRVARQLLLRLVATDPNGEISRRRLAREEIAALEFDPEAVEGALRTFGSHGLVTFDIDPVHGTRTVEFSHDALLHEWPHLATTVRDAGADLHRHSTLAAALAEWQGSGREPDYLLDGGQLVRLLTWRDQTEMRLTSTENRYLDTSAAREEAEQSARAEAERMLERRARNRLRALVAVVLVVVIGLVAITTTVLLTSPPSAAVLHEGEDAGFSELSLLGAQRAAHDLGIEVERILALTGYEDKLREAAESGFDIIATTGGSFAEAIENVAPEYPDTIFTLNDAVVPLPNVVSIVFAEEEGSYLAGAAAALTSKTGTIGFVGGMPVALIERFRAGYEAGARAVDPGVEILTSWVTTTFDISTAFNRPDLGRRVAEAQFEAGADVVYHAAGRSGHGVLEAAVAGSTPQHTLWFIGVDVDEYVTASADERPHILTSMIKRVDVGIYESIRALVEDRLSPGLVTYDLASHGVGLAESGGLAAEHRSIIDGLAARVIDGEIEVPDAPGAAILVDPEVPEPTADARVTFDGRDCRYDGPLEVQTTDVLALTMENATGQSITFAALATDLQAAPELNSGPSGRSPPSWADLEASSLFAVSPSTSQSVFLEPAAAGYAVYCLTEDWAYPATFIAVRSP
ncbi:MAG TPA: BMP family ABC transporter substrate-binding protein [Acidimicrobiia bacterium]